MKRQLEDAAAPAPPAKEPRTASVSVVKQQQRRAVPPGYLHDLLHTRHLMKTVGLRAAMPPSQTIRRPGPPAAVANGRLAPLASRPQASSARPQLPQPPRTLDLPALFQHRKKFLQKKRRRERDQTPYQQHAGKPIGLLSMPEDVLLKMLCFLEHDDIKPMFLVCKQLGNTLKSAIRFHFNFATPSRAALDERSTPAAAAAAVRRPDRHRAVTGLSDVMAHLQRRVGGGHHRQRTLAPIITNGNPPGSTHSTAPRALSFTPAATPLAGQQSSTPLARQLMSSATAPTLLTAPGF